jgi:ferric-dicitrate binding protein FerR (iron transport regulator)
MGLSCLLFATIYAFYRYVKQPSRLRLLLTALPAGLALAAKHSGILLLPILVVLAVCEVRLHGTRARTATGMVERTKVSLRDASRLAVALMLIGIISIVILWAS